MSELTEAEIDAILREKTNASARKRMAAKRAIHRDEMNAHVRRRYAEDTDFRARRIASGTAGKRKWREKHLEGRCGARGPS